MGDILTRIEGFINGFHDVKDMCLLSASKNDIDTLATSIHQRQKRNNESIDKLGLLSASRKDIDTLTTFIQQYQTRSNENIDKLSENVNKLTNQFKNESGSATSRLGKLENVIGSMNNQLPTTLNDISDIRQSFQTGTTWGESALTSLSENISILSNNTKADKVRAMTKLDKFERATEGHRAYICEALQTGKKWSDSYTTLSNNINKSINDIKTDTGVAVTKLDRLERITEQRQPLISANQIWDNTVSRVSIGAIEGQNIIKHKQELVGELTQIKR